MGADHNRTHMTSPDDITRKALASFVGAGRHPWRPAHIHIAVSAAGYAPLATLIFDAESPYLDSDAVFAVKPSLIRTFDPRPTDDGEAPDAADGTWYAVG